MNKCFEREDLFAYAEHLLAGRKERQIRDHLTQCACCQTVVHEFERLDVVLSDWQPQEPSPWFDARVRAAVRAAEAEKPSRWARNWQWARRYSPAVLTLLVVVVALVILRPHLETPPANKPDSIRIVHPAQPNAAQTSVQSAPPTTDAGGLDDLPDYDMLQQFDVLSELPQKGKRVVH